MRRVALVGALAAVAAVAIVVALLRPSSSSVEARPFPPAADELQQLWATAPRSSFQFGPMPSVLQWTQGETRLVLDARLPFGNRLRLYAARDAKGVVCYAQSAGGGGCFPSFGGMPATLGAMNGGEWNLMAGILRDGSTRTCRLWTAC
jgi:hypothetical protein